MRHTRTLIIGLVFVLTTAITLGLIAGAAQYADLKPMTVLVAIGLGLGGAQIAYHFLGSSDDTDYNVADITVKDTIRRDRQHNPIGDQAPDADELVEQIEKATDDDNAEGLLVRLNTPGGEPVPSEDIRRAVEEFDGPTVALCQDVCASGGYLIASAADTIIARESGMIGSIGVIGSRVNMSELMDRMGLAYEQFTAGEYKDAGLPVKEMTEEERDFIQGIVDGQYEVFVDRVADGRSMDVTDVKATEAKIYLGTDATEVGLVDEVGDETVAQDWLATQLDRDVDDLEVKEFEPDTSFVMELGLGLQHVAYALGSGIADRVIEADTDSTPHIELK